MGRAALILSIVSLVFASVTLVLMTLHFLIKRISYFDSNY